MLIDLVMNANGIAVTNDHIYVNRLLSRALIAMSHCHGTQTLLLSDDLINVHVARIDIVIATYSCAYGSGLKVYLRIFH